MGNFLKKMPHKFTTSKYLGNPPLDWNICHIVPQKMSHIFLYGGFLKWWYPQIIHLNGIFHEINHHSWGTLWNPPYQHGHVAAFHRDFTQVSGPMIRTYFFSGDKFETWPVLTNKILMDRLSTYVCLGVYHVFSPVTSR